MKKIDSLRTSCRHCHFYNSEGHRGGNCELLNVFVQADWLACSQARDPFDGLEQVKKNNKTLTFSRSKVDKVSEVLNVRSGQR